MFEILHPYINNRNRIFICHVIYRVRWSRTDMSTILQACPKLLQDSTAEYMHLSTIKRQEEVTICQPLCEISLSVQKHTQHNFPE